MTNNEYRAANAYDIMTTHTANLKYSCGDEDAVVDLIIDLLHYARQQGYESATELLARCQQQLIKEVLGE